MRKSKIYILAGTSEGRELAVFCEQHQIAATISVATEYGKRLLQENEQLKHGKWISIWCGRLDYEQMKEKWKALGVTYVIDSTHPYADIVTHQAKELCQEMGIAYYRVSREAEKDESEEESPTHIEHYPSMEMAAGALAKKEGNILLTTGSKDLEIWAKHIDPQRLYVRILPIPKILERASELKLISKNIIAMQGPYSRAFNIALLEQINGQFLVTKASGKRGGIQEKRAACAELGITLIIIDPKAVDIGMGLEEIYPLLLKVSKEQEEELDKYLPKQQCKIIGIGPGNLDYMTLRGRQEIKDADVVIGAKRMVESVEVLQARGCSTYYSYKPEEISAFLGQHREFNQIAIVVSGDTGFYSGATKLKTVLEVSQCEVEVIPGIGSIVYFAAKAGITWEDAFLTSIHGRFTNIIDQVRCHHKTICLLSSSQQLEDLLQQMNQLNLGHIKVKIGSHLSYKEEKIVEGSVSQLVGKTYGDLLVVAFLTEKVDKLVPVGLADESFVRGKIPMTKSAIRAVTLSKLALRRDAICYDIGAGTGSVSVEMALNVPEGQVYAIERKDDGVALICENRKKFQIGNLHIIQGNAPEELLQLPLPTHAFIGGSGGKLEDILDMLYLKNRDVRVVVNAITLDTMAEVMNYVKTHHLEVEVTSLACGVSHKVGPYQMMRGENPIHLMALWYPLNAKGIEEDM